MALKINWSEHSTKFSKKSIKIQQTLVKSMAMDLQKEIDRQILNDVFRHIPPVDSLEVEVRQRMFENQKMLCKDLFGKSDGKSAKRIAEAITRLISTTNHS